MCIILTGLSMPPCIRVIAAGLDMDYLGKPFGPMPQLMAIAEYVTKVHAICVHCGNLAHHSHRLANNDKLVMLGEQDTYEPLCRHCFNKKQREEKNEPSTPLPQNYWDKLFQTI